MSTPITPAKSYQKLIHDLKSILEKGKARAERLLSTMIVETYWKAGQRIVEDQSISDGAITQIADDLSLDRSLVSRMIKLYELWPDGVLSVLNEHDEHGNVLNWSHLKVLMAIDDGHVRNFYMNEIIKNGWSRPVLIQKINQQAHLNRRAKKKSIASKAGRQLERYDNKLHLYLAVVEKIVDGDTIHVSIDLGFGVWKKERIRLRGINTKELDAEKAEARRLALEAKAFVEEKLSHVEVIVIQSYYMGIYGRYVGDVYYLEDETDKEFIAAKGIFLNQELLDAGLAEIS